MTDTTRIDRAARIRHILEEEGPTVRSNTQGFNQRRYEAFESVQDPEGLRECARAIKEAAIERLPELTEELVDTVEANGGTVHQAADAADARSIVTAILEARDAETVVKSKSMTTEEIDLNEAVEAAGTTVWETDLGEFVIQLADESPSHITGPAIHKSREDIAELFARQFDLEATPADAEELTRIAREFLGERIEEADAAITGANFLAADSGTLVLVTSEGNARKCVVAPPVHIAVAGIEKVIPSVADLEPFVQLLARSATGQDHSAYLSLFTPPVETPPIDFDRPNEPITHGEVDRSYHLVLLDNGRSELRSDDQLRETLYCIRCSACANSCANFQHVGGHAFGGETYSGGIATGWEAGVHGLDAAASFNDLCTGCTRCAPNCPVQIDIPWINTVVRYRINRRAHPGRFDSLYRTLLPDDATPGVDLQKRVFANIDRVLAVGSATAPVANRLAHLGPVRATLEHLTGIDRRRSLPSFSRHTFRDRMRNRSTVSEPHRTAVLYPDVYTDFVRPDRGMATVRTLEALGVAVEVPRIPESGRAPLSQGMIGLATKRAEAVTEILDRSIDAGHDIVAIEPSDVAMFRAEYDRLLSDRRAARIGDQSYEIFEYLYGCLEQPWADPSPLTPGAGTTVVYHPHCQARTLELPRYTIAVLERLGYEVDTTTAECCGMAGSFGYKREYYEVSNAVGESLASEVQDRGGDVLAASGTSCLDQLEAVTPRSPCHPIELVSPGLPD